MILMGYQEGCYVLISNQYLLKLTTLIFGRLPPLYLPNLNTENAHKKRTPTRNNWYTKNGSA